jgi:tripartite-type tricarboxylate transporter receptor subunit TctC
MRSHRAFTLAGPTGCGLVASGLLSCFAAAALAPSSAIGQAYPARPIRLVVPATPGGGSDVPARIVTQALTDPE